MNQTGLGLGGFALASLLIWPFRWLYRKLRRGELSQE